MKKQQNKEYLNISGAVKAPDFCVIILIFCTYIVYLFDFFVKKLELIIFL